MSILLTGAAGFIGFHVAKALLEREHEEITVVINRAHGDTRATHHAFVGETGHMRSDLV